ncbi:Alpha/Beta hydrolase protein [Amylostereum chailletii]|nr:Alpha/Beta hydrolase protein [Amylostereum chailletii]
MDEFLDIPYVSATEPGSRDIFREFDLYVPHSCHAEEARQSMRPLICFVHGGAWRSEDKGDHNHLARRLAFRTGCPVAVPNYRLTKPEMPLEHPGHAEDILQFLVTIVSWSGPPGLTGAPYDPTRIFLMGHSCSAHMLASILLESSWPSLVPPANLIRAVCGVVFSEGIYDIDLLLRTFPAYRGWFIANTFGDRSSYAAESVTTFKRRESGGHIRWLIVHSTGDTLVDILQSEAMYNHLVELGGSESAASGMVMRNWGDLKEEHNDVLRAERFIELTGNFITADVRV